MGLPEDLLSRSAEEAVRRICLAGIREARKASERIGKGKDPEAVHDFRVAVRRLRSIATSWPEALGGSVRKRHVRALRELQEATNPARDAEVALAWFEEQRRDLDARHEKGVEIIRKELRRRRAAASGQAWKTLDRKIRCLEAALSERLGSVPLRAAEPAPRVTFGEALCAKARSKAETLATRFGAIRSGDDVAAVHRTRLAGKRLRYLVEPAATLLRGGPELVDQCKALQDLLGDLHDAQVLLDLLTTTATDVPAEEEPGLLELTRRVLDRIQELDRRVDAEWRRGGMEELLAAVASLRPLTGEGAARSLEIERKFLLRGFPELPRGAEVLEIEQGWLPGDRIQERLRRVRAGSTTRYLRTIKLGTGLTRVEVEEEISAEIFASLWPLTDGCRVRKLRHRVREGAWTWEVDEFLDRELFLAEVELLSPSDSPELPAWLAPRLEREVTEDPAYANRALARAGSDDGDGGRGRRDAGRAGPADGDQ